MRVCTRCACAGKGFQQWVPDFIFAPALATGILTTLTPILFDRYDLGREARARRRSAKGADAGAMPPRIEAEAAGSASKKRA